MSWTKKARPKEQEEVQGGEEAAERNLTCTNGDDWVVKFFEGLKDQQMAGQVAMSIWMDENHYPDDEELQVTDEEEDEGNMQEENVFQFLRTEKDLTYSSWDEAP